MKPVRQRGFTLIEMLVATGLFVTVMTVAVGSLLVILDANRKAQNISSSINNVFFSMETITRLVRTGYDFDCGNSGGLTDCPDGASSIHFTDDRNRDNEIFLSGSAVSRTVDGETYQITSDTFAVQSLRFIVTGSVRSDTEQPTVTVILRGIANPDSPEKSELIVQSTLTQRLLDL